jgi:tetratricopeptide (TPR) repeat protein
MHNKQSLKRRVRFSLGEVVLFVFCLMPAYAQETLRFRNEDGTPINQDYFTHVRSPGGLLHLVEKFHFNERVFTMFRNGQYQYVVGDLNYTLEKFPNHPGALQLLGAVAILMKNPSLPISYYEKALSLYPQHALTHAQFGSYLVEMGAMDDGIARLKKATELDPKVIAAHVWLAKAYYQRGDKEAGNKAAEQARKLGHKGPIPGAPQ